MLPMEAEFGLPQWGFGMSTYAFESQHRIAAAYTRNGVWHLALIQPFTGECEVLDLPYTVLSEVRAAPGRVVFHAAAPTQPTAVVQLDLDTRELAVLQTSGGVDLDPGYLSIPEKIEFPTAGGKTAHGYYYQPANKDYQSPAGDLPPMLVFGLPRFFCQV